MNKSSNLKCFLDIVFKSKSPVEIASFQVFFNNKLVFTEEKINYVSKFLTSSEDFPFSFHYQTVSRIREEFRIEMLIEEEKIIFENILNLSNNETKEFRFDENNIIVVYLKIENNSEITNEEIIHSFAACDKKEEEKKKINNQNKNKKKKMKENEKNKKNISTKEMNEVLEIKELEDMEKEKEKLKEKEYKNETESSKLEMEVKSNTEKETSSPKSLFENNSTVNDSNDRNQNFTYGETNILDSIQKRLTTLENTVITLKDENIFLKNEITSLKEENTFLKNEITSLKEENASLKEENEFLKEENAFLKNENKIIKERLNKIENKEENNLARIENLKNEIEKNKATLNSLMIRFLIEKFISFAGNHQKFYEENKSTKKKLLIILDEIANFGTSDFNPYFINLNYFNDNNLNLKKLLENSTSTFVVNNLYGMYSGSSEKLHFDDEKNPLGDNNKITIFDSKKNDLLQKLNSLTENEFDIKYIPPGLEKQYSV